MSKTSPAPTSRPSPWKILWLDQQHTRLTEAPHLGEYDAIVVDDEAPAVVAGFDEVPPGATMQVPAKIVAELRHRLKHRTTELLRMLIHGGVLVVRLRALSGLHAQVRGVLDMYDHSDSICFSDWWIPAVSRLGILRTVEEPIIAGATGDRIMIDEPDHVIEPYLLTARYAAVLEPLVFADKNDLPRRLASNPVGTVVACQVDVGEGTVLLVPAGGDQGILRRCLDDLLLISRAPRLLWPVPEEVALLGRYQAVTDQLRQERGVLLDGLRKVWGLKAAVLEDTDVKRVMSRLRKAEETSTPAKASLSSLHNLVEIIEDRFGGEAALTKALGIPKSIIAEVKRPANEKRLDIRHSTVGEPEVIEADVVLRALEAAKTIVQSFVTYLYDRVDTATGVST